MKAPLAGILAALLLLPGLTSARRGDGEPKMWELLIRALKWDSAEAERTMRKLAKHPNDLDLRLEMLGYHFYQLHKSPAGRREQILWWIKNKPRHPVCQTIFVKSLWNDETFDLGMAEWNRWLESHPKDPDILAGAANFLTSHFKKPAMAQALDLLARGQDLEPSDPYWPRQIGTELKFSSRRDNDPAAAREILSKALTAFERALALDPDDLNSRAGAAEAAVDGGIEAQAQAHANLLAQVKASPAQPNVDSYRLVGCLVLARLSSAKGDLKEAARLLEQASGIPGLSWPMVHGHFNALVVSKRQKLVLAFLEKHVDHFPSEAAVAARLQASLKEGKNPFETFDPALFRKDDNAPEEGASTDPPQPAAPFLLADFEGDSERFQLAWGDEAEHCSTASSTTAKTSFETPGQGGKHLRWSYIPGEEPKKCDGGRWSWVMLGLKVEDHDLSKLKGLRFLVRGSEEGLEYDIILRGYSSRCARHGMPDLTAKSVRASKDWKLETWDFAALKPSNASDCAFEMDHVFGLIFNLGYGAGSKPRPSHLDFDQIEFY